MSPTNNGMLTVGRYF